MCHGSKTAISLAHFAGPATVFGGVMKAGAKTLKLEVDEVGLMDTSNTAYERSHYTFSKEDGSVFDHGK